MRPTNLCLKNSPIEKPSKGSLPSWVGPISLTLKAHKPLLIIPGLVKGLQLTGKISINLPLEDWLWRKLEKLNLTLVEGFPSRSADAGGLQRDHFVKNPHSQTKWYGLHTDNPESIGNKTFFLYYDSAQLNSPYSKIIRPVFNTTCFETYLRTH